MRIINELSYGRVDVVSLQQLRVSCASSSLNEEECDLVSRHIGMSAAPNAEMPAVILFERLREWISEGGLEGDEESVIGRLEKSESATEIEIETKAAVESIIEAKAQSESILQSIPKTLKAPLELVEMTLIELLPKGYTGNLLDRHMEYSLRDMQAVHPIEVRRRFSDFVELREFLMDKYPSRIIPRLPIFTDDAFIQDRIRGLKRFLGIVAKHPVYSSDPVVRGFLSQPAFKAPKAPPRKEALTSQIPTADLLIKAGEEAERVLVEKASIDLGKLQSFLTFMRDYLKSSMTAHSKQAEAFKELAGVLKGNDYVDSLCRGCEDCSLCLQERRQTSQRIEQFVEGTEAKMRGELEFLEERVDLLLELFGACGELIGRGRALMFTGYGAIDAEIAGNEREHERLRSEEVSASPESIERIKGRIEALKADRQQHETFDKFVQFCLWEEVHWAHAHKPQINHLLQGLIQCLTLDAQNMMIINQK